MKLIKTKEKENKMDYPPLKDFIKMHLKFRQHWNKKVISMSNAIWQPLPTDTWLDGCEYAIGSLFKCFETSNFGWIVFHPNTKTPNGNIPGKRIIKY